MTLCTSNLLIYDETFLVQIVTLPQNWYFAITEDCGKTIPPEDPVMHKLRKVFTRARLD